MSCGQAYKVFKQGPEVQGRLEAFDPKELRARLNPGEVHVAVEWSGINFKDALGPTGKGRIQRRFPLVVGIDLAGKVIESKHPKFQAGDLVLANGCDLGEKIDGGFTTHNNISGDILLHCPQGLSPREAMIFGTAGFTAALCRHRMEQLDQNPKMGPVLVTGASGGVGSFAASIFHQGGYSVIAMSGKSDQENWLRALGAESILRPEELPDNPQPLEAVRFGGAVDNVGGKILEKIIPRVELWGNIASVGLALGPEFKSTVMPHILRGVSLLGISSNNCPHGLRAELWKKLGGPWRPKNLETFVHQTVALNGLDEAFQEILNRRVRGRILVDCHGEIT